MAALNLTIDNAPTSPNDRAREDFTMVITKVVAKPNTTKFFENSNLSERVVENLIYTN